MDQLAHLHFRLVDLVCRSIKLTLFWLIRYPCYQHDELAAKISALPAGDVCPRELAEFAKVSTKGEPHLHRKILMAASLLYALKNFYVPYLTLRELEFRDLSTNSSVMYPIDDNTYMTACLRNNCTQLLRPHTGKTLDIRHFPLIPLCHPRVQALMPPTTYLGPYALIMHAMFGFIVLVLGVALPLSQLLSPLQCETLMFLTAPALTRDLMIERVKNIYESYRRSYENYLVSVEQRQLHRLAALDNYAPTTTRRRCSTATAQIRVQIQIERLRKAQLELAKGCRLLDPDAKRDAHRNEYFVACSDRCERWHQFVIDCLPCVRRLWWHLKAQSVVVRMFAAFTAFILVEMGLILSDIVVRTRAKRREFELLSYELLRSGCRQWIQVGAQVVYMVDPRVHDYVRWTLASVADNLILVVLLLTVPSLTAIYYMMDCELTCWRLELQSQIDLMSELTRLQLLAGAMRRADATPEMANSGARRRSVYGFEPIADGARDARAISEHFEYTVRFRDIFLEHTRLGVFAFTSLPCRRYDKSAAAGAAHHRRSALNGRIGLQQVAIDMLSEVELSPNGYVILMEKLYISFRLFMEHVRHCSDTTPPLTFVTHLLSYGLIVISVWHSNLIQKFNYEHLLIVVSSCSWSVLLIGMMSKFHARVSVRVRIRSCTGASR